MKKRNKIQWKSLKIQIIIRIGIMFTLILMLLGFSGRYFRDTARTSQIQSSQNVLRVYTADIGKELEVLEIQLRDLCSTILQIQNDTDMLEELSSYLARSQIFRSLKNKMQLNSDLDMICLAADYEDNFIYYVSSQMQHEQVSSIRDFFEEDIYTVSPWNTGKWTVVWMQEESYFFMAKAVNAVKVAFLVKTDRLLDFITDTNSGEYFLFTDHAGNPVYSTLPQLDQSLLPDFEIDFEPGQVLEEQSRDIWYLAERVPGCDAVLLHILSQSNIFSLWNGEQFTIIAAGLLLLFLLLVIWSYLSRNVVKVIYSLREGMYQVERGDLDYRLQEQKGALELQQLGISFNQMVMEIQSLTISKYEKMEQLQEEKLKYLLTQVRPHFFLNAIATVHGLTFQDKNEQIRSFLMALSRHLRYMIREKLEHVSLQEELEHAGDFVQMQQIRFPERIFVLFDVEEEINPKMVHVPILILHSILENCFKYALNSDQMLMILVKVQRNRNRIEVVVEDNGPGFNKNVLEGSWQQKEEVGLRNISETLRVMYGERAGLFLENANPRGARVILWIPADGEGQNEASDY